jgi:hypothetical protein
MDIIYIIVIVLFIAWLGGLFLKFSGKFIHLLLVIAVIILPYRFLT